VRTQHSVKRVEQHCPEIPLLTY